MKVEMANDAAFADAVFQRLEHAARPHAAAHHHAGRTDRASSAWPALLLQAACRLGTSTGGAIAFDMPLSRNEVAEYLALNADTLSRIMSRLVREKRAGALQPRTNHHSQSRRAEGPLPVERVTLWHLHSERLGIFTQQRASRRSSLYILLQGRERAALFCAALRLVVVARIFGDALDRHDLFSAVGLEHAHALRVAARQCGRHAPGSGSTVRHPSPA